MKSTNYEDLIIKRAMDLFAEEGLKFFGINKKVKELGPTELVVLETKNMFMDYTFLMEDDTFIHFEFQTTNKGKVDLRRFRAYEALLSHQTGKDAVTYVVYSGNIKNPVNTLETGISEFRVNSISMASKDGDKIYNDIVEKIKSGIDITKQDIISLTFTPIMGGNISTVDKILNAIGIIKDINKDYKHDVESILYAFANKFLSGKDLEKVKEELKMTELGKSLIQEGIEKGKEKGKAELLIKMLMHKFKKVPDEYKEKIKTLSEETIELIATDIFELNSIEELERYF
ncbi:hypothetical protein U732_1307 [Clostridium argentinense CDC 2741]|uniref:DUF4351 domain-containing protein n=1 Tax=Clostridium argentinense CDC 2741 TaxID=1418104 RepID=A0A0C1U558_9CLOT|nr:DUF4351 domain-containing protein [Clostridium argentinense]ARC85478.1 hypothetical protein RSJ17_13690 [Clostridium argentinense]KIE46848.1 hypothetical protein U732_1307 [Clostridium argentinense CDC 2741]NFF39991.1 DUF4351 domain-containing protein [Clostridium argentinense]NFP50311.1 DUF4351 domain-containing protein [Clostridium argentinense]NFP71952.1 DUF4351 domain-containing protein [Clostridium argentinense]